MTLTYDYVYLQNNSGCHCYASRGVLFQQGEPRFVMSFYDQAFLVHDRNRVDCADTAQTLRDVHGLRVEEWEPIGASNLTTDTGKLCPAQLSLWHTFAAILSSSRARGFKKILFFEDDVELVPNFADKCKLLIRQNAPTDIIYLGLSPRLPTKEIYQAPVVANGNLRRPRRLWGTHALLIDVERCGEHLAQTMRQRAMEPLDVHLNLFGGLSSRVVFPYIAIQKNLPSTIN